MPTTNALRAPFISCGLLTVVLGIGVALGGLPIWLPFLVLLLSLACSVLYWQDMTALQRQLQERDAKLQELQTQLDKTIQRDPLTLALSQNVLEDMLAAELQRANRTAQTFSFALIDIDGFNAINQNLSAQTGDIVLKRVAQEAMKILRVLDRLGRFEGSVFGIILPTTWVDQATIAVSRLGARVDAVNWSEIAPTLQVSFCTGLTTNAPGDTFDTMLQRARQALAQAKTQGKGQVAIVEQALPEMDPDLL